MLESNVADRLSRAAGTLRETAADPPGAGIARNAADKLDRAAGFLREHHMPRFGACRDLIRRYPGAMISFAVAIGFLLGSARRRAA